MTALSTIAATPVRDVHSQVPVQRAVKRAWERAAAVLGGVLIVPLLLLIAVLIRLDSSGPVIFRQTRVGRDGRAFTMLKFRTMSCDAEDRRDEVGNDCDGGALQEPV